jgi:hypothetical protein
VANFLSASLMDAGLKTLDSSRQDHMLTDAASLEHFFGRRNHREQVKAPDWQDHMQRIIDCLRSGTIR